MNKFIRIVQIVFGIPWLVFGTQHFVYVNFVAGLVPAFFPAREFWVYLTGAAMFAASVSFIFNRKSALAARLLGLMLVMFFLLIQVPKLAATGDPSAVNWTRVLQDAAIAAASLMLAEILSQREENEPNFLRTLGSLSRYAFAALLIVFGIQQFFNLDFLTAKVPEYLPLRIFFVYLTGLLMIAVGVSVFVGKKTKPSALALGAFLLLFSLLRYLPQFLTGAYNAVLLTAAMLDLTIICGVFILASASPKIDSEPSS